VQNYSEQLRASYYDTVVSDRDMSHEHYDLRQDKQDDTRAGVLPTEHEFHNFTFQSTAIENLQKRFSDLLFPQQVGNREVPGNGEDAELGNSNDQDDDPLLAITSLFSNETSNSDDGEVERLSVDHDDHGIAEFQPTSLLRLVTPARNASLDMPILTLDPSSYASDLGQRMPLLALEMRKRVKGGERAITGVSESGLDGGNCEAESSSSLRGSITPFCNVKNPLGRFVSHYF
jgi:hypothetical protein